MSVSPNTYAEAPYPPAIKAWFVVGVLYLAYMLAFIDRQIIAFLVGPIRADLQITDFQFSLIHGLAFVIFYASLGIPIGILADKYSRRNIITTGIALWSLMTALCGLANNYWQLFLYRLGVGVGEGALSPSAVSMLADYFPPHQRGLAINLYSAGVHGGIGVANIFGGVIVGFVLAGGAASIPLLNALKPWQMTFVLVGLPGLLIALLAWSLREPVRREKRAGDSGVSFLDTLSYLRKHWRVYVTLIVGAALTSLASYAMYSWVPALFDRAYAWSSGRIGLNFGVLTLIFGTGGLFLSGVVAGRLVRKGWTAVYTKIMCAVMLLSVVPAGLLVAVPDPYWTLGCLALMIFLIGMPIGLAQVALQSITPNEMRAQVIAIYLTTVSIIGLGIGPSAVAAVTDYVFKDDRAVGMSLALVASAAALASVAVLASGITAYQRKVLSQD
jgi:MFS family permease